MSYRFVLEAVFLSVILSSPSIAQTSPGQKDAIAQHSKAAQQFLQEKRPDLAIPELQKVVALDPGNVDAHGNLGVLLYFRGDYRGAIPELRTAVKQQHDLWKIQALLGMAEGQVQDPAATDDLASTFPHLQDEPLKIQVGSALVAAYTLTGDIDKAAYTNSALLELRPADPALLFTAYELYSQLADKTMLSMALAAPGSAQMHLIMARELMRHDEKVAAIHNFREALEIDPALPGAHYELGMALYNADDDKEKAEAEFQFQAAVDSNPHDEKAVLMLGVIAARRFDWKTASSYDARALGLQPDDPDACLELAKALLAMNEQDKAEHLIEHAIEIEPTDASAHYRLSTLYRKQGKREEAEKQLAEYRKYKSMKDKLESIFHDMRVNAGNQPQTDDTDAQK